MKKNELLEMKKSYNYEYTLGKDYEDDILDMFDEYSSGYIGDVFSEISDNEIPFKTHDLLSSISDMSSWIDEGVFQLGMPKDDTSGIIIRLAQQGYYIYHTQILYNNINELINNYVIDYVIDNHDINKLKKDDIDYLLDWTSNLDNNDTIDDIIDCIDDYLNY